MKVCPIRELRANPGVLWKLFFTAGKTFAPGDVIYLRNGYHGFPTITGHNAGYVTIQPKSGHSPKVKKLEVDNASGWIISGLTISPEVAGSYVGHNIVTTQYNQYFVDYAGFDFHLKAGSPAINAGSDVDVPVVDKDGKARVSPFDVGAYEY